MGHKKTIDYWRHPTKREIKFGEGAIHWLTVDIEKVQKPDGSLKKMVYSYRRTKVQSTIVKVMSVKQRLF